MEGEDLSGKPAATLEKGSLVYINEDLLHNILSRLPAVAFASAACVCRSWSRVCSRVFLRPKITSALSLNPSPQAAVEEVLDKVLSAPVRPRFAIACIGLEFNSSYTHQLITKRLGSKTTIITSIVRGIIGKDAVSNDFREISWTTAIDEEVCPEDHNSPQNMDRGITLVVGFVPGMKIEAIPLLHSKDFHGSMIDKFVTDIMDYTSSVSDSQFPAAIIMFGDQTADMKPVLQKLDYAMPAQAVVVGDESGSFECAQGVSSKLAEGGLDAVALIFARDRYKSQGMGEVQFHVSLSTGVSSVGSTYKAVSVRVKGQRSQLSTWLTARSEGLNEILDGQQILNDINDEIEERIPFPDLYVGVTKRRKCSVGSEKAKVITWLEFHNVLGGDEEYLFVDGNGIKTGDVFRFYLPDPAMGLSSSRLVSKNLENIMHDWKREGFCCRSSRTSGKKMEACGGIIFSCCGRGESFFGFSNVDSYPFLEHFPEVPLAGMFCGGEIGRFFQSSICYRDKGKSPGRSCLHVYSTVYLLLTYIPAAL